MPSAMVKTRHPGVYARGSRYVVPYVRNGVRHKPSFRTLSEARQFKNRLLGGEIPTPPRRVTVADYAARWLTTYQGRTSAGITDRALRTYARSLDNHGLPFFGFMKMADVRRADVRDYIARLEAKGLAPSSIKRNVAPLAAMFATAVEDDELASNPFAGVRINRRRASEDAEEEQAKALTLAQLETFLGHVPDEHRLLFRLLADTGLRVSEAFGLNIADIEFGQPPMLHVRRQHYRGAVSRLKTRNARRDLPIPSSLARDLWTSTRGREADEPLFATRTGARHTDGNLRRRVLAPAAAAAGVPWMAFHTLRHTCASRLLDGGKSIAQVSRWLGHADPAFTLRTYVHLMDEGLGDAEFMGDAIGSEGPPTGLATPNLRVTTAPHVTHPDHPPVAVGLSSGPVQA